MMNSTGYNLLKINKSSAISQLMTKGMKTGLLTVITAMISMGILTGCDRDKTTNNPNILYNKDHEDPIKKLETETPPDESSLGYRQRFYVPIYSDIYVDRDNQKVLLSATLSIRNTSVDNSLYIKKIDYYNTRGDFVKSYVDKTIELPTVGTLNYIVEKEDDTGGTGANFIIEVEAKDDKVVPVIEAVMVGNYSNKGMAFVTKGVEIP